MLVVPLLIGAAPARTPFRPRNLIFMVPDGTGPATLALARMVADRPLALDSVLVGACETGSLSSRVTDSAASATAYACGVATQNQVIGQDGTGRPVETLMEKARARGMATGAVVTSAITDATPGAFFAHVRNRGAQDSIAVQELEHRPDVFFGGGLRFFRPPSRGGGRTDSLDLVERARGWGYHVALTRAEFDTLRRIPALALLSPEDMAYEIDRDPARQPSLAEMTERALALLARSPRGFVLEVEGSLVDHTGHGNDPAAHAREALAYDEAVRAAIRFARRDGHTLVVSVADHETGGLSLGRRLADSVYYDVRPEFLLPVKASTRRMADSIRTSHDTLGVIARLAAIAEVSEAERAALAAAGRRFPEAIGELESRRAHVAWTTWGHTAVDVGVYAFGPGSERFRGVQRNDELGRRLAQALELDAAKPH